MKSLLITLSLIALLAGCTPGGAKGKLVKATQHVDQHADDIIENANVATDEYKAGGDPVPMHEAIKESAKKIKVETREARQQATATTNVESDAMTGLKTIAWIVGIVAVVGGAIYFGVGKIVRPILARAGMWISSKTRAEASRVEKAIRTGDVAPVRELAYAKRTGDPAFDRAYAEEQAKHPAPPAVTSPASGVPSAATATSGAVGS